MIRIITKTISQLGSKNASVNYFYYKKNADLFIDRNKNNEYYKEVIFNIVSTENEYNNNKPFKMVYTK